MNPILRLKSRLPLSLAMFVILAISTDSHAAPTPPSARLARVNLSGSVADVSLPVFAHLRDAAGQDYAWVMATDDSLRMSGLLAQTIVDADASTPLYLARSRRSNDRSPLPPSLRILHDDGHNLLLAPSGPADRSALSKLGYELRPLPSSAMVFAAPKPAAPRADPPSLSSNSFVAAMVARVQSTNLYARMSELTGEIPVRAGGVFTNIATRNTYETNSLNRALSYAQRHLQALGLTVSQQDWSAYDSWEGRNVASRNLIAERLGSTAPDEIVVICAHIDSLPENPFPAPGADDNASGSVAVLAAARAMRDYQFERTIRYVLFTGEEQGLFGSAAYAQAAQSAGDNVVGVINLDMISYDGNDDGHINLTTRRPSDPGYAADMQLVDAFTNAVAFYGLSNRLVPLLYADGQGYSDHEPFWNVGIPAILAIEDWENDVTPHYHQSTDRIDTLNLPFFEAFTKASTAALAHLAGPIGPVPPAQRVSNAVHEVRGELEMALGNPVPTLGLVLQTPDDWFFASSSATPEQALSTNTTFRFASNTKNFTATSVLLLQQMGLLDITNRIVDFIPGTDQTFIPEGTNWAIPHKELITIQQLLRHSAGVYDVDNDVVPGCGGDSYTTWMSEQDPEHPFTVEEMVAQAALHQLSYFAPDEGYHYSNTGYAMLAEIVARVYSHYMGEPKTLSDCLYELNIVGPDIRFPNLATDTALPEPFLPGTIYLAGSDPIVISNCNMSAQVGEGNGYGTLPALNRHVRATLKGEGVLNADMARLMRTNASTHKADYAMGCTFSPDYGFGHNGARIGNLAFMGYRPDIDVSMAAFLPLWDYTDGSASWSLCIEALYEAASRALAALGYPRASTLAEGVSTNLSLTANQTNTLYFTATHGVYYGVHVSGASADVLLALSSGAAPEAAIAFTNGLGWISPGTGTFRLDVSSAADTPATLRLYTLTNTIARVSALVTNLMAQHDLVGCGFSLVDGSCVVMETGFGFADLARGKVADQDTVFMIGSCSKTFGAVAAMQLAEEGRLDLDASITNALPGFAIHQRFADNTITPRTILTHHSGLPGDIFNQGFTVRPLLSAPDAVQTLLADEHTLMPTNTMWAYNNGGFVMLGQMFRHLAGQELDVFARQRLFDRMGMTNSSIVFDLPHIQQNLARPYIRGTVQPDEYVNLFFAGAIYSTASDMARYMRMLLAGGMGDNARVISNATLRAMALKQNSDVPLDQQVSLLNMGLGFLLDPLNLQYMGKVIWHDGGTTYFRTLMRVATDAQLGCFISCNSYEGAVLNYAVVDAALQWAYEEKTGIPPPSPLDPGAPAEAVPPPERLALATNGVFVTSDGYDRFRYDGTHLFARFNAQSDESSESAWTYRENGWFTPTNAYAPQLTFTQSAGRVLSVLQTFDQPVTNLTLLGERSSDIAAFHPAWSNRLGRWWATNLHPDDIAWHGDDLRLAWPMLRLAERDHMLLVQTENLYVMSATNDAIAFAAGLGRNKGSSLRASGPDSLAFMGVTYRSETNIPVLAPGTSTNGITLADETHWLRIPASSTPLTLDLATDHDLTAYLFTEEDEYLGQANRAHAFHLDVAHNQPVMAAVLRNGTNTGPWTLAAHTNAIPFYRPIAQADWPEYLITHSNLYGPLDFGYVFVSENRAEEHANLLKLAVARMASTNASAKPYFFCHGGPGTSSIRSTLAQFLRDFTATHDVFLLDQRGINFSQPDLSARVGETMDETQYRVARLQDADLSAINTLESSHDLDDIAQTLSLSNVTLHGHSYGSLLAQTLMRRQPGWLEAAILDGVVAPSIPFLEGGGPVRYNAYQALFSDVANHPTASLHYPDFENDLFALARQLTNSPVVVQVDDNPMTVDGFFFLNLVEGQMGISDLGDRERIPCVVWRASRGETQSLAELAQYHVELDNASSGLMSLLVSNHDFMPFFSMDEARRLCEALPDVLRQSQLQSLEQILSLSAQLEPCGQADNSFTNPVSSPLPALVINGTYDRATGTNWAAEVASHLPNAHLVIAPTIGHGALYATNGCMTQLFRNFLANPAAPLDTPCLANLGLDFPSPWPTNAPELPSDAPATNVFPSAGSAAWYRFTAASGIVYALRFDDATLNVVGTNARTLFQSPVSGNWFSEDNGEVYLWLVSAAAATNVLSMEVPFILSDAAADGDLLTLTWQGPTGATYTVEAATDLAATNAFAPLLENIGASNLLERRSIPIDGLPAQYFRIATP